jgi:hypothetical protein
MSAFGEAVQRVGRAIDAHQAAEAALTEAKAELAEARNVLRRYEIDPEYRENKERVAAA